MGMTEQEAIKYLNSGCLGLACEYHMANRCKDDYEAREKRKDDAIKMSIKALEEVEQYRALGTVEELGKLKEKQTPKKAAFDNEALLHTCPSCSKLVGAHQNYCWNCGQKFYVD